MDTIEKPVVDDLTFLEFNEEIEEPCNHSQHEERPHIHEGPAAWWQEGTCPSCGHQMRGYRCDRWVQFIMVLGHVYCGDCYHTTRIEGHLRFTPLSKGS